MLAELCAGGAAAKRWDGMIAGLAFRDEESGSEHPRLPTVSSMQRERSADEVRRQDDPE